MPKKPRIRTATAGRIGIDTGGTFTDFVRLDHCGLVVHKLRTTPDDPSRAILEGIAQLSDGVAPDIVHGSTVATNAVLERKGARVALVATAGFEDVVRIGRQTRSELYNFFVPLPRPLVDPDLTFGLNERLDAAGTVLVPINAKDVDALQARLKTSGAEVVAVCLLHSYANPAHERDLAARLRGDGWLVSASSEVLPEYREYERWSTTVVNAYVAPLIDRYLGRLEQELKRPRESFSSRTETRVSLKKRGRDSFPDGSRGNESRPRFFKENDSRGRSLSIMQSNGGSISSALARAEAVRTVLSGPAAGVVGARAVAEAAGFPRAIAFDMGGTSTDVSLIDGRIPMSTESKIGDFPVRLPVIDIHTVGAGGGSIAFVDSGGALRVGPRSAGSVPGPACYGAGTELTVTDANLLLGRLDPDFFLGGRMSIDVARAASVAAGLARSLKLGVPELAEGVVRVANANMERAIRVVSVERGHDPRQFALVAFGGAGGMHACEIARKLDIARVLVPRHAGVLSALGMLVADVTRDYSATVLRSSADLTSAALRTYFDPLCRRARADLAREGFRGARAVLEQQLDVRYVGQSFEITLPLSADYRREFDRRHGKLYGYSNPARAVEVVAVRVRAVGITEKPSLPFTRPARASAPVPHARRAGRFDGRAQKVSFYRWPDLTPGQRATGPAVITGAEATAVVPPGFQFQVDGFENIVITARRA